VGDFMRPYVVCIVALINSGRFQSPVSNTHKTQGNGNIALRFFYTQKEIKVLRFIFTYEKNKPLR
jgi:hypothetical protein